MTPQKLGASEVKIRPNPTAPKWQSRDWSVQPFPAELCALFLCNEEIIDMGSADRLLV